jgi:hypothetical protein
MNADRETLAGRISSSLATSSVLRWTLTVCL